MIYVDALWSVPRYIVISGRTVRVPFGIALPSRFSEFITRWIINCGKDWTANRLKSLNRWALEVLAGNHSFSLPWFEVTTTQGFTIPNLDLFQYLVRYRSEPSKVRLVLTLIRSYKQVTQGSPSLSSVEDSTKSPPGKTYVRLLRSYVSLPQVPESVLGFTKAVDTNKAWIDDTGSVHRGPYGLKDYDFPAEIRMMYRDQIEDPFYQGKIVPIKDKGKWRNILVGHWAVQLKTKKLSDWLRKWLWKQTEVCSEIQQKFSDFIIQEQRRSRTILSIDLSSATDTISAEIQKELLISMGVPKKYFRFLYLPVLYRPKDFGRKDCGKLETTNYSNGQPMGLFLSFPMFELFHYTVCKFATATTDAEFRICGDDVVISCQQGESSMIYDRYFNLIDRFGGKISLDKTICSQKLAEGVGAIFLKGYPKELRIPSGKLSSLEATYPGFWLHDSIRSMSPVGRAIHHSWLSTKEWREYTHDHRRALNERLVTLDLDDWHVASVRDLSQHETFPLRWYAWDPTPRGIGLNKPRYPDSAEIPESYTSSWETATVIRFIPRKKYMSDLVNHKIISLYKKDSNYEDQ